ncbi:MAG: hypothetical protein Sylvanvirus5_3 [Sylvanvirus sp.]|uniref:Transposase n=1 Tax=Sylvanvirus sp. TaxID=2487774 RepID=A0A3G5AHE9_9VIRU|nr:MAG: hypothetical protein Sylvanvirus5_3 [Sylvanvirus sp.]
MGVPFVCERLNASLKSDIGWIAGLKTTRLRPIRVIYCIILSCICNALKNIKYSSNQVVPGT